MQRVIKDIIEEMFYFSDLARRKGYWPLTAIYDHGLSMDHFEEPCDIPIGLYWYKHKDGIKYLHVAPLNT